MKVLFFASFRSIAGVKQYELQMDEPMPLFQVIQHVLGKFPQFKQHWIGSDGDLLPHVHLSLNGTDVDLLDEKYATLVYPGDELDFFPPIQGG